MKYRMLFKTAFTGILAPFGFEQDSDEKAIKFINPRHPRFECLEKFEKGEWRRMDITALSSERLIRKNITDL